MIKMIKMITIKKFLDRKRKKKEIKNKIKK